MTEEMLAGRFRHVFIPAILLMLAGLVSHAAAARKPNLLIVHSDELNFRMLGCYGGGVVTTPNIDWLAKQGALCTRFYATTPVCSPSRAAFVSGLFPQNTPTTTNNIPMRDDLVTFAEVLRRGGYATGYAGKWHLDGKGKPQWAPERKFGFTDNRFMFNRGHWKKMEDTPDGPAIAAKNQRGQPSYAVENADEKSFTTDWLSDKAIEFIQSHKSEPFCYMVSLPDPHGPNTVRAPYDTMYVDAKVPIPATLSKTDVQTPKWGAKAKNVSAQSLRRIMPPYYGMIKCIDDNVGRIIDVLRKEQLLDHTIVVFTADHGDLCGEHGRLNKGVPYDGSAKIPMVVYYPHRISAGTVVKENLSCVDFSPTILKLMDVPESSTFEGRDASELFQGGTPDDWRDIVVLRGTNSWLCAVTDRYKLVYATNDRPWLFDLASDPDELDNVYEQSEHREAVRQMARHLTEYGKKYHDPYVDAPNIKAALRKAGD